MSVLGNRDTNLPFVARPAMNEKTETKQNNAALMRRKMFEQNRADKVEDGNKTAKSYVSPSDAILSPASQKLAGFKQRQITKQNAKNPTSRSLFSRTASNCSSGFDDVEPAEK